MIWCLFDSQVISWTNLLFIGPVGTRKKSHWNCKHFPSRKCNQKCCLGNVSHFVEASTWYFSIIIYFFFFQLPCHHGALAYETLHGATPGNTRAGIILCMRPANERWRYTVTLFLICWAPTWNDPCIYCIHSIIEKLTLWIQGEVAVILNM